MEKIIVPIAGMHCRSCELLVEGNLAEIPEVKKSNVSYKKGVAEVYYSGRKPASSEIENAVREAGYAVGAKDETTWVSHRASDWRDLGVAALTFLLLYAVVKNFSVEEWNLLGNAGTPSSLGVVFLVGITAGLSSCLALVGGLVLGVAARHAEAHPEATAMQKFRPHLFFNLGRILSYFVLGGLIGFLGSVFQLSTSVLGIMTVGVGLVMLLLGTQLIDMFPILKSISFTIPKSVSRFFGIKNRADRDYTHKNSAVLGALTFFLPCGFTQAMQIYAMSTGSVVAGRTVLRGKEIRDGTRLLEHQSQRDIH